MGDAIRYEFGEDSKATLLEESGNFMLRFEERSEGRDQIVEIVMPLESVQICARGIFYNVMMRTFEKVMANLAGGK